MATSKRARQATAYYVRVSSQGQDIRSQIPEMEAHARGHDPVRRFLMPGDPLQRAGPLLVVLITLVLAMVALTRRPDY